MGVLIAAAAERASRRALASPVRQRLLVLMGSALVMACSPGEPDGAGGGAPTEERLSEEIASLAEDMLAAVRAREPDRVVSFYDAAVFVHYEDGREVPWTELEPQMRRFMESAARIDLLWMRAPTVVLLGPHAALVHGVHSFEGELQDGTVLPRHTGTWSGVFRRREGTWKLIHSHSSEASG